MNVKFIEGQLYVNCFLPVAIPYSLAAFSSNYLLLLMNLWIMKGEHDKLIKGEHHLYKGIDRCKPHPLHCCYSLI